MNQPRLTDTSDLAVSLFPLLFLLIEVFFVHLVTKVLD